MEGYDRAKGGLENGCSHHGKLRHAALGIKTVADPGDSTSIEHLGDLSVSLNVLSVDAALSDDESTSTRVSQQGLGAGANDSNDTWGKLGFSSGASIKN